MCNTKDLLFACHHITTIIISTCRGTYTRTYRDHDEPLPACSRRDAELRIRLLEKCPWCARKEKYAALRTPVERIRTINYNQPTAATRRAVLEAEANYDREMATLGKMNLRQPGKWQKVSRVAGHQKVKGGSPLRKELKAEDIDGEVPVEENAEDGWESASEDDGPSPSLMGEMAAGDDNEGVLEESSNVEVEESQDSPLSLAVSDAVVKPTLPNDEVGGIQSLALGSHPMCCCRPGYLCGYC